MNAAPRRKVVVAPPTLVRLPTIEPVAVFAGARGLAVFEHLQNLANTLGLRIEISEQWHGAELTPCRISAHAETGAAFELYAKALGIAFDEVPPSWRLGQFSAAVEDVIARLNFEDASELNWSSTDFDVRRYRFRRREGGRPQMCLTRYVDPVTGLFRYYFWRGSHCAQVDGDWGRFVALREARSNVLWFDPSANLFAAPESVPLPRLLARALVLCSGYAPRATQVSTPAGSAGLSVFVSVPKGLAELTASKLGQILNYRQLAG